MRNSARYRYFDLPWLMELSFTESNMLNAVVRAFLNHLPEMLNNVQLAVNESSPSKLTEAIEKVSSVASLFTRKDFSHRFLVMTTSDGGQLSPYTVARVNSMLVELEALQNEVKSYEKTELYCERKPLV